MTRWEEYKFEERIRGILNEIKYMKNENHHFGRPFLTPYQIAIEYSKRCQMIFSLINLPIGGSNIGVNDSLAKYIAHELSRRIGIGEITDMQGAFISNKNLKSISFNNQGKPIESSLTRTQNDLSQFRLID